MLEIKFVGDIFGNQRPIYGWFHGPRNCAVVCYFILGKFVPDLWTLSLLILQYICKYGLLQNQVRQWCAGLSHTRSPFFWNTTLVPVQCCLIYYSDKYWISDFWWKIHHNRGCCSADLYIPMWGPCEYAFPWLFYKILCLRPNSSGLEVPYLKQLLGVVGVMIFVLLMDWYCMCIHMCCQEYILPVGFHRKLWYLNTTEGHQIVVKLLRSGGNL